MHWIYSRFAHVVIVLLNTPIEIITRCCCALFSCRFIVTYQKVNVMLPIFFGLASLAAEQFIDYQFTLKDVDKITCAKP